MKPRLAYIAGQFPLRSETFVYREIRELRRRGWDVACVTLRPSNDPPEHSADLSRDLLTVYTPGELGGISTLSIRDALFSGESTRIADRLKLIHQCRAASALAGRLQKLGIQHIHCHFAHAPTTIGMYAANAMGIPFSFTGHANDLFQRRQLLRRKLQRAKFVSCISEEHRKLYQQIHPRDATAYPIIRCGVDVDSFTLKDQPDAHPPRIILTVCRLVEKKGVDTLIRAFAQLPADAQLIIAGDGPQRAELEKIASENGVSGRIKMLGAVSNDHVRELLQSSDIFALPCRVDRNGDKDGIPVVLMEAMACGLPVVAGDLPAIRELVVDQQTGLLVDASQHPPTAVALNRLIDDPAFALKLGKSGRNHVLDEFSLAENISRLEHAITA